MLPSPSPPTSREDQEAKKGRKAGPPDQCSAPQRSWLPQLHGGGPGKLRGQGGGKEMWGRACGAVSTADAWTPADRMGALKRKGKGDWKLTLCGRGSQSWLHIPVTWASHRMSLRSWRPPHSAKAESRAESPVSALLPMGTRFFSGEGCPVHCAVLRSISRPHSLDASSTPSFRCDNQILLQTRPHLPTGSRITPVRTSALGGASGPQMGTIIQTLSCLPGP